MSETTCPCRLRAEDRKPYSACCAPYLEAGKPAPTAEALMRAATAPLRSARSIFFWTPSRLNRVMILTVRRWRIGPRSRSGKDWTSFPPNRARLATSRGLSNLSRISSWMAKQRAHRERSLFRFDEADGHWYFVEEANRKPAPIVKGDQPGRNDPCPCGSGKKYKKCCGAAA